MFERARKLLERAVFKPPVPSDDQEHVTFAVVLHPKGCNRRSLGIEALDSRSRELAWKTYVTVEGKVLPCVAIREKDGKNGGKTLLLEVQEGFFTFAEIEE